MSWSMSSVPGSIVGRHQWMGEILLDAECTSRSGGGSCGRRVTQWQCLNDCYQLAMTWLEKLVPRAWFHCDNPSDPALLGPLPICIPPQHATMQNAGKANENRNRHINMEMVTDDEGRIPVQYQNLSRSPHCKILRLLHHTGQLTIQSI